MFKNVKKSVKRAVIFILILAGIAILVITGMNLFGDRIFAPKAIKVIIDSDSGNDIDGLFAITRAITAPELDVTGLISSHWEFHPEAGDSSLNVSQRLHEELLTYLNSSTIPHPRGAEAMLRFSDKPVPAFSPGAEFIISSVKGLKSREKLNIICLGALTNVASAILIDPEIIPKIRLYSMALKYESKTKIWDKNEFNVRNDLDAIDVIFNAENLELHIMTVTCAKALVFNKQEADKFLEDKERVWSFLLSRWKEKFKESDLQIMKDVALIEALIDPELVKTERVLSPPENKQKSIEVYTSLNKELMLADFWAGINREIYINKKEKH